MGAEFHDYTFVILYTTNCDWGEGKNGWRLSSPHLRKRDKERGIRLVKWGKTAQKRLLLPSSTATVRASNNNTIATITYKLSSTSSHLLQHIQCPLAAEFGHQPQVVLKVGFPFDLFFGLIWKEGGGGGAGVGQDIIHISIRRLPVPEMVLLTWYITYGWLLTTNCDHYHHHDDGSSVTSSPPQHLPTTTSTSPNHRHHSLT